MTRTVIRISRTHKDRRTVSLFVLRRIVFNAAPLAHVLSLSSGGSVRRIVPPTRASGLHFGTPPGVTRPKQHEPSSGAERWSDAVLRTSSASSSNIRKWRSKGVPVSEA